MKILPFLAGPIFFFVSLSMAPVTRAEEVAERFFENTQKGSLELSSAGKIAFGPDGLLLISDPRAAVIVAVDTGDTGPAERLQEPVADIDAVIAKAKEVAPEQVTIVDMAVNPASGKVYFSLNTQPGNKPSLVSVDAAGNVSEVELSRAEYVKISLPSTEAGKLRNVTDLAFADFSIIVAGQSAEEFANKIYQIPIPLTHGQTAEFFSAETYHVSHKRWETKAPIQSFIPYESAGKFYVVGAFACTPIAKFPLSDIESGANIKGTSVVELGSGNRPRDMFTYVKDGQEWLVTNTQRFKDNLFGPSAFWAARVKMEYLDADEPEDTNENAIRRNVNAPSGPDAKGIEVIDELFGAVHVSQLDNAEVIVLRETESGTHTLELVTLP